MALPHVSAASVCLFVQCALVSSQEVDMTQDQAADNSTGYAMEVRPTSFFVQSRQVGAQGGNDEGVVQWKYSELYMALKILGCCIFILLGIASVVSFFRIRRDRELQISTRMEDCLACITEFGHPMYLLPAGDFLHLDMQELSELHEGFRCRLRAIDTMSCYQHFRMQGNQIVFLSYQWLSCEAKGPSAVQLGAMMYGLRQLIRLKGWRAERTYVWLDILSIPQRNDAMKRMAVTALHMYAKYANAFLIICPTSKHESTGAVADLESYQSRVWTRAEQLSHAFGRGVASMYVVRGKGSIERMDPQLMKTASNVFEGEMSCCRNGHHNGTTPCDRQSLVNPLLAIYYEALVRLEDGEDDARRRLSEVELGCNGRHHHFWDSVAIASSMIEHKDQIFPQCFTYAKGTSGDVEKRVLFGDLIKRVDERFHDGRDVNLRLHLQKERLRDFSTLRYTKRVMCQKFETRRSERTQRNLFHMAFTEPNLAGKYSVSLTPSTFIHKAWTSLPKIVVSPNLYRDKE